MRWKIITIGNMDECGDKVKKRRKIITRILIFAVFLTALGYFAYKKELFINDPSYPLSNGNIDVFIDADAFIIRDEIVVRTNSSGLVQYFIAEGEKIKKNQLIAQIQRSEINPNDKQNEVTNKLDVNVEINMEDLDYDIAFLFNKIKYMISDKKYSEIFKIKDELELKLDKKDRLSGLESPESDKIIISESKDNNLTELLSPESGIISYYIDGYENILQNQKLQQIDFNIFAKQSIEPENYSTQYASDGDIIYKVVNSNHWELIAIIDKEYQDFFEIGKVTQIEINNEHVTGEVIDIFDQGDKLALLMDMNYLINDYQKNRKVSAKLNPSNYKGLKIEKNSLVKVDGDYGVYVLNVNNKATFRPVKVIGYDEEYAIVVSDYFTKLVNDKSERVSTVKLYDEVLRDGEKYLTN
ncbi:MAG: hypothetical protein JW702_10725 [Clostridiales bacterium]|nr:hypothetical protein [Clostridiales bacterium]